MPAIKYHHKDSFMKFVKVPREVNGKILGFFGDCAPKKWPSGQIAPGAVSEKARSAFSSQPSASNQRSAVRLTVGSDSGP